MNETDTARSLIDSVFGGTDHMTNLRAGSACVATVRRAIDAHERAHRWHAATVLEHYISRAVTANAGARNLCGASALLTVELLRSEQACRCGNHADLRLENDGRDDLYGTAALDAVNYAAIGDFDAVERVFNSVYADAGDTGMQRLVSELIDVHVLVRRMLHQHP